MKRTLFALALALFALTAHAAETADASIVHASQVRILYGHDATTTTVFVFAWLVNASSDTYVSDGPALAFSLPEGASNTLDVQLITASGATPLASGAPVEGATELSLRIPPGQSNLRLEYHVEPYEAHARFRLSLPFRSDQTHLFVAPRSVEVSGTPASPAGHDENLGLSIYHVAAQFPGEVAFTFADHPPPPPEQETAMQDTDMDVIAVPNRFSEWRGYVILGALLVVLFAFAVADLMRRAGAGGAYNLSPSEHAALLERLYDDLAALELRHRRGEVSDTAFRDGRRHLRLQVSLLLEQEERRA